MRYSRMHVSRAFPWTTALVLAVVAVAVSDAGDRTTARTSLSPYLQPELYREGGRKRAELQHCCSYRTRRKMRCDMMRLRGGRRSEPAIDRLNKYHIKFPLGMQLYEAAGGVGPGPGDTWLETANLTLIQNLLKRGATVNFQGPGKYTPLHFAASRGFLDVVTLLLDSGADVNASSKWLWTPLHTAAEGAAAEGHTEVVRELAARGGDILARTINTNLPLDEATGSHHWRTASLLKHLMGPDWFKWARKSYHEDPSGQYTYDRIETMTDDEIALYWQNMMRSVLGPEKFSALFKGVEDPLSEMTMELEPSVRAEAGWVDSEGEYHAPWEDEPHAQQVSSEDDRDSAVDDHLL